MKAEGSRVVIGGSCDSGGQRGRGSGGTRGSGPGGASQRLGRHEVRGSRFEGVPSSRGSKYRYLMDSGLPW